MDYLLVSAISILALFILLFLFSLDGVPNCLETIPRCGGEYELRIANSGRRSLRIVTIGIVMADGRLGQRHQGLAASVKLEVRPDSVEVFTPDFELAIRFYYRLQERCVTGWYVQLAHGAIITSPDHNVRVVSRLWAVGSRVTTLLGFR